jgi:hypothetical protein
MPLQQYDERLTQIWYVQLTSTNGTTSAGLMISSAQDQRFDQIFLTSDDTIDHIVQFRMMIGVTEIIIGSVNVPAARGTDGTAAVDGIAAICPSGQAFIMVPVGCYLKVSTTVAVSSAKHLNVVIQGGSF